MNQSLANSNEQAAALAFGSQAPVFDRLYGNDTIIAYKRMRVRMHMEQFINGRSQLLELNAGTGEDAIYFASKGHSIHATDIAQPMLDQLQEKKKQTTWADRISTEQCSFTALDTLQQRGPYDHVYSNFAGLNCTQHLDQVIQSMGSLVKKGGYITLVLLPSFCLWETMLLFRGKFRTAFRRFTGKKGAAAKVEQKGFRCWYYAPSLVKKMAAKEFIYIRHEGLCSLVPPSYMEGFAENHPRLYQWLVKKENRNGGKRPWRNWGDYYIITFRKK